MSLKHLNYQDHIRIGSLMLDLSTSGEEAPSFSQLLQILGDSFDVDASGRVVADTTKAAAFAVRVRNVMVQRWGEPYVDGLFERIWKDSKEP